MPLINAHVYVSKVRYSIGYFDSENTGGITTESALFSKKNIDLQRKKCGISNIVVKGTGIHRKHLYIAHAQKPLIKADVGEARKP